MNFLQLSSVSRTFREPVDTMAKEFNSKETMETIY